MGLSVVPRGQIATIVTSLEMTKRPAARPLPAASLRLVRWHAPPIARYRALFRRVGAPWLWFSRLVMEDDALAAILGDPGIEIYAVEDPRGIEVGLLELDFREAATCEISFLGLVPELAGQKLGGWLMGHALGLGWRKGVTRLWVHTCTLDHPAALPFYRKAGFVPFARSVETFADPRLAGVLPADAAPHVPTL
ncbi:MAG: GNAT family N-acetyltransferase [Sphingomonas sp.]